MNPQQDMALSYFRKLTSFLYREVGAMRPANHLDLYAKSQLGQSEFAGNRKVRAKQLYQQSIGLNTPAEIVKVDSVLPCVGENSGVLVQPAERSAAVSFFPSLVAGFGQQATVPWAFTRPKHPDS